jgi:hypothetical protein
MKKSKFTEEQIAYALRRQVKPVSLSSHCLLDGKLANRPQWKLPSKDREASD